MPRRDVIVHGAGDAPLWPLPPGTPSGIKPTRANTGLPSGASLTPYGGSTTRNEDNLTFDGVDFTASGSTNTVNFYGANVTVRNCKAKYLQYFGSGPFLVETTDMIGGKVHVDCYYNSIDSVTVRKVYTNTQTSDGMDFFSNTGKDLTNVTVEDCLVEGFDFTTNPSAHGDGVQVRGVTGMRITNCVFDMGTWQSINDGTTTWHPKNAAIYMEEPYQGLHDVVVDGCWLNGGGYTFYVNVGTELYVKNCRIGRDYGYGPAAFNDGGVGWTKGPGNVWDDDGTPVAQLS
jgi:hypothetical protein